MQIVKCYRCDAENKCQNAALPEGWDDIKVDPLDGDPPSTYQLCWGCMLELERWIFNPHLWPDARNVTEATIDPKQWRKDQR